MTMGDRVAVMKKGVLQQVDAPQVLSAVAGAAVRVHAGIATFWLLPTIGLFFLSLRSPADNADSGWWSALAEPSQFSLENYRDLFDEGSQIPTSLWNTVLITVPTLLLVLISALAAYGFAFVRFPGRDGIFLVVVLPLGVPAMAALGIFQFLWVWNDLLVSLIFADPGNAPITVAIQQQTRQFSSIDVIAPGAFVSMLVPLIVFFSFQCYFVQGRLAGSSK